MDCLPIGEVLQGDCLELLNGLPDNCVDSVVTDPPYGLSNLSTKRVAECIAAWAKGDEYRPGGKGFMGKDWDGWVPGPKVWREVYRVLKPGGTAMIFAGSRTFDLMGMALRLAGFEIADSVYWHYGNGFPKSTDISKQLDKEAGAEREVVGRKPVGWGGLHQNERLNDDGWDKVGTSYPEGQPVTAPATDLAREWDGLGTALKPATEPILLARKPCDGSFAANAREWGVAGLNIDGCRVGTDAMQNAPASSLGNGRTLEGGLAQEGRCATFASGRHPANVVFSHAEGCRCVGVEKVEGIRGGRIGKADMGATTNVPSGDFMAGDPGYADADGLETVAKWECVEGCPVRALAEQSGESVSRGGSPQNLGNDRMPWQGSIGPTTGGMGDRGTAARFFEQFAFEPEPDFNYIAKAARREREEGLIGNLPCAICGGLHSTKHTTDSGREANCFRNTHPTVKPVALMRWLCRLTKTPTAGVVLDPFAGSGTTLVAALLEGRDFIGMELDAGYVEIARLRIAEARRNLQPALFADAAG